MIELPRTDAAAILEAGPNLNQPEHAALAPIVQRLYHHVSDEVH